MSRSLAIPLTVSSTANRMRSVIRARGACCSSDSFCEGAPVCEVKLMSDASGSTACSGTGLTIDRPIVGDEFDLVVFGHLGIAILVHIRGQRACLCQKILGIELEDLRDAQHTL